MIRVNPFTGELQLVNESGGGGLPTALYDADGSVVASVDDIGNVVFANGFSTTGDIYGDLDFAGGLLTGDCDIDITGYLITSGRANIGGYLEVQGDAYFDGVVNFPSASINTDGSASFAGGNAQIDSYGYAWFGGSVHITDEQIRINNTVLNSNGSASFADDQIQLNSDGSASFASGGIQLNQDGSVSFAGGVAAFDYNGNLQVPHMQGEIWYDFGDVAAIKANYDSGADHYLLTLHGDEAVMPSHIREGNSSSWELNADGSANFAGGNIQFDSDGTADFANGLSIFFANGEVLLAGIPTGDPFDAGRVYQDGATHALYVSQG